jgi:hypothetical protein
MSRLAILSVVLAISAAAAPPAFAQELTREELKAELRQRDQMISALERRVSALEARQAAAPRASAQAGVQGPSQIITLSSSQPQGAAQSPPAAGAAAARAEETAELQALSRGLVERGLQILPKGSVEFAPSGAYTSTQSQGLVLVNTPEGISTVSDQRLRDDFEKAQIDARIGLPWRSQIEVRVPYEWRRETSALGDGSQVEHSDNHVGDVEVEFAHQFLVERGARPDLIAAVTGRFPTGRDPFTAPVASVANGEGTYQIAGRLTALKTIDPVVAYTTVSYTANFSRQEPFGSVHPGDIVDWQLGAFLAISPATSLSLSFDQGFRGHTTVDGQPIAGSDGVAAAVQVGFDQVLSSRTVLDVNLSMGLNHLAPDYQLMVTLPVRFK